MMIGPFMMAGMFYYFGDTANKANFGLEGFPMGLIRIIQHTLSNAPIPYVPGAPFLMASALSIIGITTYFMVTTKADREARYSPQSEPTPKPTE